MTAIHPDIAWTAGDDWQINATLLDENGNPFILSGATAILWALLNSDLHRELSESDVVVTITDAAQGKCSINVPGLKTASLRVGIYRDVIRIVSGGITSTLSVGNIHVSADPWTAADALMIQQGVQMLRVV